MTFRVTVPEGTIVCYIPQWGQLQIVEYPAEASGFVQGLRETIGWQYAEETPFYILWDRIVPEDRPKLAPLIIHGIAVVEHGGNELWKLIKDFQLSQLDLYALYLAADRGDKDTRGIRRWLEGTEFPPRKELVASLLSTPQYVGVAVARATSREIPVTLRVSRDVAKAILRSLPRAYWTAQDWLRLITNNEYTDLIMQYENDAQLRPIIEEFYARDATLAWEIFRTAESAEARAVALNTLVRSEHPRAVNAVRDALHDSSTLVREAASENIHLLPRDEYAKWLAHFAYHGIPDDYGETRKRAWYEIARIIPEEGFAEFLREKLR